MPLLAELLKNKKDIPTSPLAQTHFVERHFVLPKGSWADGVALLARHFPKEARPERPAAWYQQLAETHWPGRVPPGNGPFYLPEWLLEGAPEAQQQAWVKRLGAAGFKPVIAHVAYLPENTEYLVRAMQVAGEHPWTVNPRTYRVYLYPTLTQLRKAPLRPFTTTRWTPE
jgi:hypothetical protein